jgi:16S rRNA (guanine527-N7)-methyltransferase
MDFREVLANAADTRGMALEGRVLDACATHFGLLVRWNETHNLTRVTNPSEAAIKHYLDCLVPLVGRAAPDAFIDVGSGAGFPGLLAAVAWPSALAVLVEPAKKRQSFLRVAASALGVRVDVREPEDAGVAPVVLSRATFSAGARGALWAYVAARGRLLVWSTSQERATWQAEVAAWEGATLTTAPYAIDDVARELVEVVRGT